MQAYDDLLESLRLRNCIPVAEEKMLLDGLKLVLDNGWTIEGPEMRQLMQMCNLESLKFEDENFRDFFEFLRVHF